MNGVGVLVARKRVAGGVYVEMPILGPALTKPWVQVLHVMNECYPRGLPNSQVYHRQLAGRTGPHCLAE